MSPQFPAPPIIPTLQTLADAWAAQAPAALQTGLRGIPSGLRGLDVLTGGWPPGQLTVVGGRPGMGVTSFLLQALRHAAVDFGQSVLYCAPAEHASYALRRLVLGEAGHAPTNALAPGLSAFELALLPERIAPLLAAPVHLFTRETPFYPALLEAARACDPPPRLLVFDYRQILSIRGDDGSFAVHECLRGLQTVAETLAIPVLLSCGASVEADDYPYHDRHGPKLRLLPHPDHLTRYAGLVLLLYRAEYYGFGEDDEGRPTAGKASVYVAFQRHGPMLDVVPLRFDGRTGRFWEEE